MPLKVIHLGLNGWPPVASHFVALLTGVSLANLSHQDPAQTLERGTQGLGTMVQITLPKKRVTGSKALDFRKNRSYFLVNSRDKCLFGAAPINVSVRGDGVRLEVEKKEQVSPENLYKMAFSMETLQLELKMPMMSICQGKSMVVYDE